MERWVRVRKEGRKDKRKEESSDGKIARTGDTR